SRSSSTTATLRASRSQRDSVGCGTPSSPLSALADTRPAPTLRDTACALNFSPYCLLTGFFQSAPDLSYLTSTESEEATTTLRQGADTWKDHVFGPASQTANTGRRAVIQESCLESRSLRVRGLKATGSAAPPPHAPRLQVRDAWACLRQSSCPGFRLGGCEGACQVAPETLKKTAPMQVSTPHLPRLLPGSSAPHGVSSAW